MSKPRGGNRPERSVDMGSRVLKEYAEAERRREQWAKDEAVKTTEADFQKVPGTRGQGETEC